MAVTYKVLGQSKPSAATNTTLYTVPTGSGNYAVISTLAITNQGTSPSSVRVAVRQAGAAIEAKQYIIYDVAVGALQSLNLTLGITIASTDVVTIYDSLGTCSFNIFGSENS